MDKLAGQLEKVARESRTLRIADPGLPPSRRIEASLLSGLHLRVDCCR